MSNKIFITLPSYLTYTTLLWLAFFSVTFAQTAGEPIVPDPDTIMCTADVKRCDDGSWVGRTGPNCEFRCPTPQADADSRSIEPLGQPASSTASGTTNYREMRSLEVDQEEITRQNELAKQQRLENQVTLSETRQLRIINLAANISNRMEAAVERLFVIITRLEARIAILNQSSFDTTVPAATLRQAAKTLAEARTMLGDIDLMVQNATTSDRPYSAWQTLKLHYQKVAVLIRQTHSELRQVISELKSVAAGTLPNTNISEEDIEVVTDETAPTTTLPLNPVI